MGLLDRRPAADPQEPQAPPGLQQLSPQERELVTLVAQGRTDTQIAGQLSISIRTVRSHLDRIRDKTGCVILPIDVSGAELGPVELERSAGGRGPRYLSIFHHSCRAATLPGVNSPIIAGLLMRQACARLSGAVAAIS
jgi:DNA-binding CsgD family transcriptional regulator